MFFCGSKVDMWCVLLWRYSVVDTVGNWEFRVMHYFPEIIESLSPLSSFSLYIYRVIEEESALLWEMIVWVTLSKKFIRTCVRFWTFTELWAFFNSRTCPHVNRAYETSWRLGAYCIASINFSSWLARPATDSPLSLSRNLRNKGKVGWVFA